MHGYLFFIPFFFFLSTYSNYIIQGQYCTDIAKSIGAPIFHVNGDDPEAVDTTIRQAFDFRNKFKKDVFVDIIGYRRYGHNELDQPFFTQPLMYKVISQIKPVYEKYAESLIKEGVLTLEKKIEHEKEINKKLLESFEKSKTQNFDKKVRFQNYY